MLYMTCRIYRKMLPQETSVKELFVALRKTPAGKYLSSSLRFRFYKTDREDPFLWRRVLGPSAITFSHMQYMYKVVSSFLRIELKMNPKKINGGDQNKLLLAAACHDFGEAIIDNNGIGDIPDPLKTKEHQLIEQKIFYDVLKILPLKKSLKEEFALAYEEVIVDENSLLHSYFRTIEQLEYIMTAMNVVRASKKRVYITNGKLLVGDVLSNSLIPVLTKTSQYNFILLIFFLHGKPHLLALHFSIA